MEQLPIETVSFVTGVVKAAGQRLLADFGQVDSQPKGNFDLVTATDLAVQSFIQGELRNRFPDHQLIAEEGYPFRQSTPAEFCWVIDPLDGTVNFALGLPFFCVSLALLSGGSPLLGWVYDPVRAELFFAVRGRGSFLNDRRLTVQAHQATSLRPIGGSSGWLEWALASGQGRSLLALLQRYGKMRLLGSQALQLCYVAAGRLRAAISWESRLWDDAAGALIAGEAGADYTDWWGQPVFPLSPNSAALAGAAMHSIAATPENRAGILALFGDDLSRTTEATP
jgi:myo-inositol-1(or 4)-monophosphatase